MFWWEVPWFLRIMVCAQDRGVCMISYQSMTVRITQAQQCTTKIVKANTFRQESLCTGSAARCRLLAGRQA